MMHHDLNRNENKKNTQEVSAREHDFDPEPQVPKYAQMGGQPN